MGWGGGTCQNGRYKSTGAPVSESKRKSLASIFEAGGSKDISLVSTRVRRQRGRRPSTPASETYSCAQSKHSDISLHSSLPYGFLSRRSRCWGAGRFLVVEGRGMGRRSEPEVSATIRAANSETLYTCMRKNMLLANKMLILEEFITTGFMLN